MKYEIIGANESTGEEMIFIVEARSKKLAASKAHRHGMLISSIYRASRTAKTMEAPEVVVEHVTSNQPTEPETQEASDRDDESFDEAYEPVEQQPVSKRSSRRSSSRRSSGHHSSPSSGDTEGLMFKTFITPKVIVVFFWAITILIVLGVLLGSVVAFLTGMTQSVAAAAVSAVLVLVTGLIVGLLYILCIRIGCEVVVILFRMRDHLESIENKLSDDS